MTTDTVAESKKIWGVLTGLSRFVTLAKLSKLAQESAPRLVLVVCGVVLSNTVNVREIAAFYESVLFCNVASILKEAPGPATFRIGFILVKGRRTIHRRT